MNKPFYIIWDKEIENSRDRNIIYSTIEATFKNFEEMGRVNIPKSYVGYYWNDGDFGSVEWYTKRSFNNRRNQVQSSKLWDLFEKEPWQESEPHLELFITSKDLYANERTNFIFGETRPLVIKDTVLSGEYTSGKPYAMGIILSINRIKKWYDINWPLVFGILGTHEFAHLYGVPEEGRTKTEYILGTHCTDENCVMEQVNVKGKMNALEKGILLQKNGNYFCNYCLSDLEKGLKLVYS